jgi:hypothetical protein
MKLKELQTRKQARILVNSQIFNNMATFGRVSTKCKNLQNKKSLVSNNQENNNEKGVRSKRRKGPFIHFQGPNPSQIT